MYRWVSFASGNGLVWIDSQALSGFVCGAFGYFARAATHWFAGLRRLLLLRLLLRKNLAAGRKARLLGGRKHAADQVTISNNQIPPEVCRLQNPEFPFARSSRNRPA
jgi:hypothetical protein